MTDQHYPLQAAATFLWQRSDGTWQHASGTTRDISRYGVFITTGALPSPGSMVQVILNIPSPDGNGAKGQLCGKGVAVRSESTGFAAEVLFPSGWASLLAQEHYQDSPGEPSTTLNTTADWLPLVSACNALEARI